MTFPKEDIILVKILRGFKIGGKKGELQEGQVKSGASPHESDMTLRGHLRGSSSVPAADRHLERTARTHLRRA